MTPFADGYQVILYALLSEALVAFGAVVYLQGVARAVFVTQPALVAVQGEPGLAFGFPGGRAHIAFIGGLVHRVLCWAGILAVPCLTSRRYGVPGHAVPYPALTGPRPTTPCPAPLRLATPNPAEPRFALQLVAAVRRCIPALPHLTQPCQTSPSRALPCHTRPRLAVSSRTLPGPTPPYRALPWKKKSACLPASWLLLLKDAPAYGQIDRPMPATEIENAGSRPSAHPLYHTHPCLVKVSFNTYHARKRLIRSHDAY